MEKIFKGFCVLMSVLLVLSSVTMFFAIGKSSGGTKLDLFSCNDIVQNIENLEMNLTSVIYVKNTSGDWEEYQRIHGDENRIWISIDSVPQTLIDAFVSIEDQRFFVHSGVDWKRTFLAFANKFMHFYSSMQGGSTITQQLIKNLTGDNAKTSDRKLREIARALIIEKKLNKRIILEAYLNTISLGNQICGVQVASNYYFNKDVSELSLLECATLAAITKNPTAYNPDSSPEGNKERRQVVLDKMLELGKIDQAQYDEAYNADIVLDKSQQNNFEIPVNSYFVDALIDDVIGDLSEKYGCSTETASSMLYNGGYKIYATVDPNVQNTMESVYSDVKKYFSTTSTKDKSVHVQSAMTVMDYEGHIVGIVGGAGEKTRSRGLNRATSSPRQPGSTMKPLGVYALAIDKGITTYSSYVVDSALNGYYADGKKGPKEWYGYYAGKMTLQKAIERSANTIPCKLLQELGLDTSYNFLTQSLQMKNFVEADKNLASLALGGCHYGITTTESAAAYAIFGNQGKFFEPVTYYTVERATGEVVLQCDTQGSQVIQPASASIMNMLLQNVVYGSQGTGKTIADFSKNLKAYAKTGTTSDVNDLWMVGASPYYVGSVWYGFDQPEEMKNNSAAANIWKAVMSKIHEGLEKKEFEMSSDLITAKYCKSTGLLASSSCHSTATGYYVPGVEAEVCSGKHSSGAASSSSETTTSSQETSSSNSSSQTGSSTISSSSEAPSSSSSESSSEVSSGGESSSTPSSSSSPGGGGDQGE